MFVIGLTGSIAMGKSTTARFFAEAGVPVHDADGVVHALYAGPAAARIEAAFPGTTVDGRVDRTRLAAAVLGDAAAVKRLEAIVHPMVRAAERDFLAQAQARGERVAVLDIPLLFETGADARVDTVVVVSAPADIQRKRVFERAGMSEEKFAALLRQQMPDAQKRARADFIVDSAQGFDIVRAQVRAILQAVASRPTRRHPDAPAMD
ncbi:MAG: dephospho-CoA kinase [Proteobacteria bacterium]|nr:dephospho-CoA kinase [Pseudomonadota bacterium]